MALWKNFPYSNTHELNLDWLLEKVTEYGIQITDIDETVKEKLASQDEKIEALDTYVRGVMETITKNIEQITNDVLNQMIEDGELNVGLTYTAETEALDLVVTGGNNG